MLMDKGKSSGKNLVKNIDIRGRVCPMTFVYTKLALEDLNKGDKLEVLLDYRPALKSIPDNCKRQGIAELLNIEEFKEKGSSSWLLKLKRI
jgi:tRNA 2-thiouridine synthesizing protein A